jgi:DNA end-binding protein Ku
MAATIWKGYVTFGLLSIPIRLHAAARSERVSFNQIHQECGGRIKQQIFCPQCNRTVERSELKRGFALGSDEYVVIEDEELKRLAPESSESMEILEFVQMSEVDPLYFDSSYYVTSEEAGKKAYHLLVDAMQKSGYVALARVTMSQREHTVILRPYKHGLAMHQIFYPTEVREAPGFGEKPEMATKPAEVALAEQLITSLAATFEPAKYHDEYQMQVKALVEAKKDGRQAEAAPAKKLAPVIDLMEALQMSLAKADQLKAQVPKMPTETAAAAPETKRKRVKTA